MNVGRMFHKFELIPAEWGLARMARMSSNCNAARVAWGWSTRSIMR